MQRLEAATYVHAKQACYLCLNPAPGVDTDQPIEGEGNLYLCNGCIHDLAMVAGFDLHLVDQLERAEVKVAGLEGALNRMKDQLTRARARARAAESK